LSDYQAAARQAAALACRGAIYITTILRLKATRLEALFTEAMFIEAVFVEGLFVEALRPPPRMQGGFCFIVHIDRNCVRFKTAAEGFEKWRTKA
jgi:hypothetical protein